MKSWKTIILTSLVAAGIGCGTAYAQAPGQKTPFQPGPSIQTPAKGPKADWSPTIAPTKQKKQQTHAKSRSRTQSHAHAQGQVRIQDQGRKGERQTANSKQQRYSPRYSFNSPNGGYHNTRPNSHSGKAWR